MSSFIGDENMTFNCRKIIFIHWKCKDSEGCYYAQIYLVEGHQIALYYRSDDDYWLINNLRDFFGYEDLPRLK